MQQERRFYFRSIVRRWQSEIAASKAQVSIFSPYLTSNTADIVLAGAAPDRCKVFTRFEAEDFASGASSLFTLRRLCERGFVVYSVPSLHAKVVIVAGKFASIGSQNLTSGGTRNREASVVFTEPQEVARIEKFANSLLDGKRRITLEMISDIEEGLRTIQKDFERGRVAAHALSLEAERKEDARKAERWRQFRSALARLKKRSSPVSARVTRISTVMVNRRFGSEFYDPPITLLADPSDDLTWWDMGDRWEYLKKAHRYLCINLKSGRIGWARVFKSRISRVEDGIDGLSVQFATKTCKIDVIAARTAEEMEIFNVCVKVSVPGAVGELTVRAWFTVEGLSIVDILQSPDASVGLVTIKKWLLRHKEYFKNEVLPLLLEPFQYEHNLGGHDADEFFGPVGSRCRLHLRLVGRNPIIVAKAA
jgi:hypothetical protein